MRRTLIERAARGEATLTRLCREAGVSRSRFYELRALPGLRRSGSDRFRSSPRDSMTPTRRFDPALPFISYPLAVDFANTVGQRDGRDPSSYDLLANATRLRRWLALEKHAVGDLGRPPSDDRLDVGGLRSFREAVTALLGAAAEGASLPSEAVGRLNGMSAAAPTHAELVVGRTRHNEPTGRAISHAPDWGSELRGRIARSAIEVLSGPDRRRLSICPAPSCGLLFVAGRQGKHWCSESCGNRARVARHYRRHGRR